MILQALKEYYERKVSEGESGIAPPYGWEMRGISFIIHITEDGKLVTVEDTRENGVAKLFLVPRSLARSGPNSYMTTFPFWDHIGYVLGQPSDNPKAKKQYLTWINQIDEFHRDLPDNKYVSAIYSFYLHPERLKEYLQRDCIQVCIATNPQSNVMFKVGNEIVTQQKSIIDYVNNRPPKADKKTIIGRCLITGKEGVIARTHHDTPITKDAKKLVAFQKNSGYDSYGKEQAYNAPVSAECEFAYTTALNMLLQRDSNQKLLIGSTTMLFWAARKVQFEHTMNDLFSDPSEDDPDRLTSAVRMLFESIDTGAYYTDSGDTCFYVLGLSPASGIRIAVRFWIVSTVDTLSKNFYQYFKDLRIVHNPKIKDDLPIRWLMRSLVNKPKDMREWDKKIPPDIVGDTVKCIFEGLPLPRTLLQAALLRTKAERDVSYPRAKLIKGCVNSYYRDQEKKNKVQHQERSLTVSLDEQNTNCGYRLGRLFAVLEQCQLKAQPGGANMKTIRDRFYASASTAPATVFGSLMRLNGHHLAKMPTGKQFFYDKLIKEIISGMPPQFPAHLSLMDQGAFAIGYYHQREALFPKHVEDNA